VKEEKKKNSVDQAGFLNADNIAMFSLLEFKENNECFLVCNTHLVFPANHNEKKLSQMIMALKAFETIINHFSKISFFLFVFEINYS